MDARIGTELAGYRIEGVLGRGGMSVVYVARHIGLDRQVALKILAPELAEDERFRERFVRESRMAAGLEHPNIVPVYEAGEADGVLFIAMRYVRGTDLKSLIRSDGALAPARTLGVLAPVASALDAAHRQGLVHRDVKPANILIAPSPDPGEHEHVYLSDFGLTKRSASDSGITATGQFVGTLDYAAPEQFEGRTLDARTDVYSLGCVLYECLTGKVPYERDQDAAIMFAHLMADAPAPTEANPALPAAIDAVVRRAMAKEQDDRYSTAGELVADARRALGTPSRELRAETGVAIRRRPRRSIVLGGAAIAFAVIAAVVAVVLRSGGGKRIAAPPSPTPLTIRGDSAVRVDPKTGKITDVIPISDSVEGLVVGDGAAWVEGGSGVLYRIDLKMNGIQNVNVGGQGNLAFGRGALWFDREGAKSVVPINPGTGGPGTPVPIPDSAGGLSLDGDKAWLGLENETPFGAHAVLYEEDLSTGRVLGHANFSTFRGGVNSHVGEGADWIASTNILFKADLHPSGPGATCVTPSNASCLAATPGIRVQTIHGTDGASDIVFAAGSVWVLGSPLPPSPPEVIRVDPATNEVLAKVSVHASPLNVAVSGSTIWVICQDGTLQAIDTATSKVVRTFHLKASPQNGDLGAIAIAPDGGLWITAEKPALIG